MVIILCQSTSTILVYFFQIDENYRRVSDLLSSAVKEMLANPELIKLTKRTKPEEMTEKSSVSSKNPEKSLLIQQLLTQYASFCSIIFN